MELMPRTPKRAPAFPPLREHVDVVDALAREADEVGITTSEALRQIIQAYLANPFPLSKRRQRKGPKGAWGAIRTDQATIDTFKKYAQDQGVSVAEAIRQIVRRYLAEKGFNPSEPANDLSARLAAAMNHQGAYAERP